MLSLNPSGYGVCRSLIHFNSVSCLLIILNLLVEFASYVIFFYWLNQNISRSVTFTFKVPIQKIINFFRLIHSTIVFTESIFRALPVCPTYCILQVSTFHVRTKIRSSVFQSSSELFITENCLKCAHVISFIKNA